MPATDPEAGDASRAGGEGVDSRALTRVLLGEGNEVPVRTSGLSMGPTIRGGECVVVRATAERDIRFGDVIVFDRQGTWVCHRVVRVRRGAEGRVFVTKGDPVLEADPPVPFAAVLGRVVRVRRADGDVRMEGLRARAVNGLLAAGSLAAGWWWRRTRFRTRAAAGAAAGAVRPREKRSARLVRRLYARTDRRPPRPDGTASTD